MNGVTDMDEFPDSSKVLDRPAMLRGRMARDASFQANELEKK